MKVVESNTQKPEQERSFIVLSDDGSICRAARADDGTTAIPQLLSKHPYYPSRVAVEVTISPAASSTSKAFKVKVVYAEKSGIEKMFPPASVGGDV